MTDVAAQQTGQRPAARKPNPATFTRVEVNAAVSAASDAAKFGPEHTSEPVAYDGILLASFGGPEGQDEVIPFLRNVTAGRGIPDERLEEVAHHYRHYGGVSPINEQNRQLKASLERELERRGIDLPVFWGNRNSEPYFNDVLLGARAAGCSTLIAIATSAYSSFSSCRQYREDFADALEDTGLSGHMTIDKVRAFFDHPGFVAPFIEGVRDAVLSLAHDDAELDLATEIEVLFTTHSVPMADAANSGPPGAGFGESGAYAAQHLAVAEVVALAALQELSEDTTIAGRVPEQLSWQLVYQSRSGPPSQPWLEPDINDVIEELPSKGAKAVVVVPIGFVSDHMEVLWDLDNEAKDSAADAGLAFRRTPTPGIHAKYVEGLVDLVLERRDATPVGERPAMTSIGPWFDVCRPGGCANKRLGFKPAVSGLLP